MRELYRDVVRAALLGALASGAAGAQERPALERIGAPVRAALERVIDSARVAGLPVAPLTDKIAEGVLKGADDERILKAVQALATEYGVARSIVGPSAPPPLLGAAASALHAGFTPPELRRLVRSNGGASDGSTIESALVTLVDLVAKRVPTSAAMSATQTMLEHGAGERELSALRAAVEQDVLAGRSSEASLADRAKAQLHTLDQTGTSSRRRPPTA